MFNLCDILQKCNLAVKQDLSTVTSPPPLPAAATTSAAAANNLQHTHKTEGNSLQ